MNMRFFLSILFAAAIISSCKAQNKIPEVYSNIQIEKGGRMYLELRGGRKAYQVDMPVRYTLDQVMGKPAGTESGIAFNFQNPGFTGYLYYGFIHQDDGAYPYPVYFRDFELIRNGEAHVNISSGLAGRYDMIDWEETGKGILGYRIINLFGEFLYDGKVAFEGTGPFTIGTTLIEGPFLNLLGPDRATISFKTNVQCKASVVVGEMEFSDTGSASEHNIEITGLVPDTEYSYVLKGLTLSGKYSLRTAPEPGSQSPFTFAYASDSRDGQGGGERNIFGVNAYIMKKIMALARQQESRFFQFTGDLITGYHTDKKSMNLQYANWKRAVEPFWHHMPLYVGMGNHEALQYIFRDTIDNIPVRINIDRFPFETESMEAVFMENFVMPENGPVSEDGSVYDPNPDETDFPSYKESVFYYTYGNIGMIVLNSDYLYNSSPAFIRSAGGNLHGYIMDNQLQWLKETLDMFEKDPNIDHVFVTIHTPAFPNGGHVKDDMWYNGKNDWRPFIAGKPLQKGIIERRDEFLDLLVNNNSKVVALLTGDEHNYNRLKLSSEMEMYPEPYFLEKLSLRREIWQVNNGAAGAPYYAQEETPWSEHVQGFTTRNALVLIRVEGSKVSMRVINPDTLELIDEAVLKE